MPPTAPPLRAISLAVAALLLTFAAGCETMIKSAMLTAPNRGKPFTGEVGVLEPGPHLLGIDRQLHVEVGPPDATLRLWIRDPVIADDAASSEAPPTPRGTILALHGWRADSLSTLHIGHPLAEAGYRVVHVDLRGQGGSTGDAMTFGALESRDLVQVADSLHEHGLLEGPLGVWGASMGAATAIQYAARDSRVEAVVAVSPYTSMRDITPQVTRRLLPLMHLTSDDDLHRLADEAAAENDFSVDDADTLAAIQRVQEPILIIHGTADAFVPADHGRKLHAAATGPCELIEIDWTGHITVHITPDLSRHTLDFFDRTLSSAD